MYSLLAVALTGLLISLALTPLCRDAFLRLGIVDLPDRNRKLHSKPIPRVGGIAVFLAYSAAFLVLLLLPLHGGAILTHNLGLVWRLLPPVAVVFATGLLDDLFGLKPWQKLAGQVAAAVWALAAGVHIGAVSGFALNHWFGAVLTVVWLVACANAVNLIDGLDGLASGVALLAAATILIAALLQGNFQLALAIAPLLGALLGFLRFNFNPASIFLGDCGSLTIGFLLGCFGALWGQKSATVLGMIAPAMALAVPILDTALAVVRRFLCRKPIFGADREHIHHRLVDRGLTPRRAVLLIYAACACAATLSLLNNAFTSRLGGIVIVAFCAVACLAIQQLKYPEFEVAHWLLTRGAFRDHLNAHIALRNLDRALANAQDALSCWRVVQHASGQLGFHTVKLCIAGRTFGESRPAGNQAVWTVRVPLADNGDYIHLSREFNCTAPLVFAPLAECLRRNLTAKARCLDWDTEEALVGTASLLALSQATHPTFSPSTPMMADLCETETFR